MKNMFFLCLCFLPVFSVQVNAQLQVFDGVAHTILEATGIEQAIYYAQSMAQFVESVQHAYQQVQHMIEAEKRAIENLRSITDVKNFDDFMKWQNRQLYMEREVEDRFNNLGVKIGGKTYRTGDIDDIPEAMQSTFGREYWENEFTEDQRREMYLNAGLSPGNYTYVKKWREREGDFVKKIQAQAQLWADENEDAANNYNHLIDKYASGDEVHTNEILQNINMSLIQQEMVLREIARQMAEKNEYDVAMNQLASTPPNPPRLSDTFNARPFGSISDAEIIVLDE